MTTISLKSVQYYACSVSVYLLCNKTVCEMTGKGDSTALYLHLGNSSLPLYAATILEHDTIGLMTRS